MAYLTEAQKTGIIQLLEGQGNPIVKGGLLDLDMVRPFHAYPTPEKATVSLDNPGYHGFVETPKYHMNKPMGPPFGLAKEFGANPFLYVKDVEKFQPEWTPGATEEGKFNKQLADTIAHEGRHKLFNKPRFDKILDMLNTSDLGGVGKKYLEEEFNRYLDLVYSGKDTHLGLSLNDLYQNPLLYKFLRSDRPGQGRFTVDQLTDLFWKMTQAYRKETRPRAGLPAIRRRPPRVKPVPPRGGGADVFNMPIPPSKKTYVTPPRGGGADVMPVQKTITPRHAPHPDRGGGPQPGSMPTGTAGRNPWGRAHGGLMDIPLPGRKRDI